MDVYFALAVKLSGVAMMYEVEVAGMGIDSESQSPVLLLKLKTGGEAIPIIIGLFEATSIVMALREDKSERPMTHDLFCSFIEKAGILIKSISVYDLKSGVYYSKIKCSHKNDEESFFYMDARPSDAVALALRVEAPIFIDEKVVDAAKNTFTLETEESFEDVDPIDNSDEGQKWADYLKNLSPEDFGKYKV